MCFSFDLVLIGYIGGMWILVVDDEVCLVEGVCCGFEVEGFVVDVVYNGIDGFWWVCEMWYDVIVFDLMMFGMSGWKVCEVLCVEENWMLVFMFMVKDGEWDQVEVLEFGVDDYVMKLFLFVILVV